jgi:hypothetical protein
LQRLSYGNCVKIERQIVKQKKPWSSRMKTIIISNLIDGK